MVRESPQLARPVGEPSQVRWWRGWARWIGGAKRKSGADVSASGATARTSFAWTAPRQTQLSLLSGQWAGALSFPV